MRWQKLPKFKNVARWGLGAILLILIGGAGRSFQPANPLSQSEIRQFVVGKTLISAPGNSVNFQEYHAPGGQVYGANDGVPNDQFCWRLVSNRICYTLPGEDICYWVVRDRKNFLLVQQPDAFHTVRIVDGDRLQLQNQSTRWNCPAPVNPMQSERPPTAKTQPHP
jgi:hypothetical protein